jgi:hypothetical protein
MNWYIAKVIFRIICGDGQHAPQFDEQLRLIRAECYQQALTKAQQLGVKEQDNFRNDKKENVSWKFIDVTELYCLSEMRDGNEFYSSIVEPTNDLMYEEFVNYKGKHLNDLYTSEDIQYAS